MTGVYPNFTLSGRGDKDLTSTLSIVKRIYYKMGGIFLQYKVTGVVFYWYLYHIQLISGMGAILFYMELGGVIKISSCTALLVILESQAGDTSFSLVKYPACFKIVPVIYALDFYLTLPFAWCNFITIMKINQLIL